MVDGGVVVTEKKVTKVQSEKRFYIVRNEKGTRDFFISYDWMTERRLRQEYDGRIIKMIELANDDNRTLTELIKEFLAGGFEK